MKHWNRLPDTSVFDEFARAIDLEKLDEDQFVRLIETMDMLGNAGTGIELSKLSTSTFVWIIERASSAQLDALMAHDNLRTVVLSEIFGRVKVKGDIPFIANFPSHFDLSSP